MKGPTPRDTGLPAPYSHPADLSMQPTYSVPTVRGRALTLLRPSCTCPDAFLLPRRKPGEETRRDVRAQIKGEQTNE